MLSSLSTINSLFSHKIYRRIRIYVYLIFCIFGSFAIILFHIIFPWLVRPIHWSVIIILAASFINFMANITTIVNRLYEDGRIQHESDYNVFCEVYEQWSGNKFSMFQVYVS
jgi:hypothetical protein